MVIVKIGFAEAVAFEQKRWCCSSARRSLKDLPQAQLSGKSTKGLKASRWAAAELPRGIDMPQISQVLKPRPKPWLLPLDLDRVRPLELWAASLCWVNASESRKALPQLSHLRDSERSAYFRSSWT